MTIVRYLGTPVRLFIELQELLDGLQREVQISAHDEHAPVAADVVEGLVVQREALRDVRVALLDQAMAARDAGIEVADLDAEYPDDVEQVLSIIRGARGAAAASEDGRLLTPPSSDELRRFQTWVYDELERQLLGGQPEPYAAA